MEPFRVWAEIELGVCPKCRAWFGPNDFKWELRYHDTEHRPQMGVLLPSEHLDVTCPRCGWSFQMETADAKAEVGV